jgi:hypothetical protein
VRTLSRRESRKPDIVEGLRNLRFRTHGVAWFFLLGWLVHRSTTPARRLPTTVLCVLTIPGFFGRPEREWFIALGIVLLLWSRDLPVPRAAIRPIAVVAAASMWIYLSHFRIWPPLDRNLPAGVAYAATILRHRHLAGRRRARATDPPGSEDRPRFCPQIMLAVDGCR